MEKARSFSPTFARSSQLSSSIRRYIKPATLAVVVFCALWYFSSRDTHRIPASKLASFESAAGNSHANPWTQPDAAASFWDAYSELLQKHKPPFSEIERPKDKGDDPWIMYEILSKQKRPDMLEMTEDQFDDLKKIHRSMVKEISPLAAKLPFVKGSRGIIFSAANDALTIMATSVRMLRLTGNTLPVEVFINEWEAIPCEEIFPGMNARCRLMEDYLPRPLTTSIEWNHFFYKAGAILFSSFEHVLYLDADLFPVMDPEEVFVTEPFISKGMVLWPDYFASSASHLYYEMVGRSVPEMKLRASTESGAMIINKNTHAEALLLATYYNAYGPKMFYRLLSQGSPGEGDKETWLAAIEALRLPFYTVMERPSRLGYRCNDKPHPVASGQHHPLDDFLITSAQVQRYHPDDMLLDTAEPRILFVHGNLPKYDSSLVLGWTGEGFEDMLRCDKGKGRAHRMWGPKELNVARFGWDVEKNVWDSMRWFSCAYGTGFTMWTNGTWHSPPREAGPLCKDVASFYKELLPNERYQPGYPEFGVRPHFINPWD